jgi:hypothetical protein
VMATTEGTVPFRSYRTWYRVVGGPPPPAGNRRCWSSTAGRACPRLPGRPRRAGRRGAARWRPTTAAGRLPATPSTRRRSCTALPRSRSRPAAWWSAGRCPRPRSGRLWPSGLARPGRAPTPPRLGDPTAVPPGGGPPWREGDRGDPQPALAAICDHRDLTAGQGEAPRSASNRRQVFDPVVAGCSDDPPECWQRAVGNQGEVVVEVQTASA